LQRVRPAVAVRLEGAPGDLTILGAQYRPCPRSRPTRPQPAHGAAVRGTACAASRRPPGEQAPARRAGSFVARQAVSSLTRSWRRRRHRRPPQRLVSPRLARSTAAYGRPSGLIDCRIIHRSPPGVAVSHRRAEIALRSSSCWPARVCRAPRSSELPKAPLRPAIRFWLPLASAGQRRRPQIGAGISQIALGPVGLTNRRRASACTSNRSLRSPRQPDRLRPFPANPACNFADSNASVPRPEIERGDTRSSTHPRIPAGKHANTIKHSSLQPLPRHA